MKTEIIECTSEGKRSQSVRNGILLQQQKGVLQEIQQQRALQTSTSALAESVNAPAVNSSWVSGPSRKDVSQAIKIVR